MLAVCDGGCELWGSWPESLFPLTSCSSLLTTRLVSPWTVQWEPLEPASFLLKLAPCIIWDVFPYRSTVVGMYSPDRRITQHGWEKDKRFTIVPSGYDLQIYHHTIGVWLTGDLPSYHHGMIYRFIIPSGYDLQIYHHTIPLGWDIVFQLPILFFLYGSGKVFCI